ncbi:C4-dicarboxylate ABC transporter permease [Endozoicomonas montiporae]|uniref:TRAP transporter small permease protein n=2 Tax=Endozoicomonas montiporae TaxID=1027273 RepID=A0A081N0P1_9GAMM|nr:TRAP transporter small permease subunit [Endozoicomonas montiporae]AMO54488.1 tripartite AtP-independent periplasmic transporter subunit DctQ [Endozoicomonas montiporae CL-33]KEQ12014.1 C4-dicarboxylate ABC transporter permease [Endozoicomonas montiporae]
MKSGWIVLHRVVAGIDQLTEKTGQLISWFNLLLVLSVCLVVLLRYFLNIGSIALQETAMYFHALIFLGASGYTLKHQEHVRVDVFYRRMSPKGQALVNSLGTLFLLIPVCLFIGFMSWEYVVRSWSIMETSTDPGGLPAVFLLKSLILFLVFSLFLQGIAELLRSLMLLANAPEVQHG